MDATKKTFDQGGHDVVAANVWCVQRFLIEMFMIVRYGDNVSRFCVIVEFGSALEWLVQPP